MPIAATQAGIQDVPGVEQGVQLERFSPSESMPRDTTGASEVSGAIASELAMLARAHASTQARRAVASTAPAR